MTTRIKNKYKYITVAHRFKQYTSKWNGIPAFLKRYEAADSLYNHFFLSVFNHIILFILLWVLLGILKIGITNPIFKPKEKIHDIEFTLNNSTSRGHKPKLSMSKPKAEINTSSTIPNNADKIKSKPVNKSTQNKFAQFAKFTPSPVATPDAFSIPIPKFKPASGSAGSRRTSGHSSGNSSSDLNPADIGTADGSQSGSGTSNGTGFDKNAARKAITPYDISPYVNELKRNIRMNWKPAKNSEGKNVELFLRIAKDGRLIILNVKRTSEIGEVDEAALNAVRRTKPLSPLPSKYSKSYLDLIFTFNSSSSSIGSRY